MIKALDSIVDWPNVSMLRNNLNREKVTINCWHRLSTTLPFSDQMIVSGVVNGMC